MNVFEPPVTNPPEPLTTEAGPFRPNVAALVLRNNGNEILLGERYDTPGCWQWPQGGLDAHETPEQGLHREISEEIGVSSARIIYRYPFRVRYRFPRSLAARFHNVGQEQYVYLVEIGEEPDLDKASDKEFRALQWKPLDVASLLETAAWFKMPVYRMILEHLVQVRSGLVFGS